MTPACGRRIDYLGYKVAQAGLKVYADAQSKPDVAINEAVRLIEQEKVDMLLGFYSSAECVPVAARVEQFKKFMWITTCIASPVLEDRQLKYVFRPQPSGTQWGLASTEMLTPTPSQVRQGPEGSQASRSSMKTAPTAPTCANGNVEGAKKAGFKVVMNEGYSVTRPICPRWSPS
jgi:hypothetical protein